MAVQIILKNSAVEGKNPTAAQLAQGEIALNFHESGPYLTCEDTAGNVKRIAGVQQGTSAPANALEGAFWWNTGTDTLFIYAEGGWNAIGGGGGGGGGGNTIVAGEGLTDVTVGTTQTLNVNGGEAIEVSGDAVNVDLDTDDVTVGLQLKGAGTNAQLQVKTASADQLGSVRIGNGINIDGSGIISADIPAPLSYQGNINPTNEGGDSDPIPTGSVGDAWTCSWGTANTSALLDTSPNWRAAVNGATATTEATIGDLLIIRANDGSNADDWTLVETGTVDNSATISVGDGQTNAFPPDSPAVGDVWYNTDDGRTYVFILDNGGQNEWVDVSPQGNQMLWKKDSANLIEPQTNTDELRINTLASDDTSGGRVVYADAGGTLVANGVGAGLEIDSGAIRVDADTIPLPGGGDGNGDAGFWSRDDTTNVISTRVAGDNVTVGTNAQGIQLLAGGVVEIDRPSGQGNSNVFRTDLDGTRTITFLANGTADFDSQLSASNLVVNDGVGGQATLLQARDSGNNVFAVSGTNGLGNAGAVLIGGGNALTTPNIRLNASGSAEFAGSVAVGGSVGNQTVNGVYLNDSGYVASTGTAGNNIWLGYSNGTATATSTITADGSASFAAGKTTLGNDGSASFAEEYFFFNPIGNTSWGKDIKYAAAGDGGIYLTPNAGGGSLTIYKTTQGTTESETDSFFRCFSAPDDTTAKTEVITFRADGSAAFQSSIHSGNRDLTSSNVAGVNIQSTGSIYWQGLASAGDTSTVFRYTRGKATGGGAGEGDKIRFFADGDATFTGTVNDNTSDIKFKKNVKDAPTQTQLDDIKALKLRTWQWRENAWGAATRQARHQMGLVAQEAERVDPNLAYTVEQGEDDSFKAIDHKVLTMKLLGALQEATTRIEALEAEVAQLKGGSN